MLPSEIAGRLAGFGAAPAVIHPDGTRLSYGGLAELTDNRRRELAAAGAGPGVRVALVCAPSAGLLASALALLALRATVVPVGASLPPSDLQRTVRLTRCGLVVGPDSVQRTDIAGSEGAWPEPPVLGLLSSGSTGRPKLVLRSESQVEAGLAIFSSSLGVAASDRVLAVLPLEHSYGFNNVLLATLAAGGAVILAGTTHPRAVAAAVRREGATVLPAAPVFFDLLSKSAAGHDRPALASLRAAISVGTALPRRVHAAFQATFGVPLYQSYGTSETGPVALNTTGVPDGEFLPLGTLCPQVHAMILNDNGVEVADGVPGELVVESPAVGLGYDSEADETPGGSRFEGRRFHTGDRVVREHGTFRFRGRLKVLIAAAGHKVDPAEVEQVLLSHPDIADAAVVGHPAGEGREEVKAFVVLRRPVEPLALMDFCSRSLAAYKVPRIIEIRDRLPRNDMGKLQREAP